MYDTCWGNNPLNDPGYMGCYRQDTAIRKIFIISPGNSVEQILYDFSLQVGDTVVSYLLSWACIPDETTIVGIDSVFINGNYRKRWEWQDQDGYSAHVIEGIGSEYGLLEPTCEIVDGPLTTVMCYKENGTVIYTGTILPDTNCNIVDAVKNIPEKKFAVTFSPNPFHTTATLEINPDSYRDEELKNKNCQLKIYNTLGALVLQSSFSNLQSVIISRENMTNGLYFFELNVVKSRTLSGLTTMSYELIGSGKFVVE